MLTGRDPRPGGRAATPYTLAVAFAKVAALEVAEMPGRLALSTLAFDGVDGFCECDPAGGNRISFVVTGELTVDALAAAFTFVQPYLEAGQPDANGSGEPVEVHLYTSDPSYRHSRRLADTADGSQREQVAAAFPAAGGGVFDAFWSRAAVIHRDDVAYVGLPTDPMHDLEHSALQRLREADRIHEKAFPEALHRIRALVRCSVSARHRSQPPPTFERADVRSALLIASDVVGDAPTFRVIDRGTLAEERAKTRVEFVGRPPTWADVVAGPDATTRFVERAQSDELTGRLREIVIEPLRQAVDARLPALFVLGSPGSGKSTIVRRVLATLVEDGEILALDLGPNHGPADKADVDCLIDGIKYLAQSGRPVIVVLDDPLFKESGWDVVLKRLASLGIARGGGFGVVAASPTFLMETYGHLVNDGKIRVERFTLGAPTASERRALAVAFDRDESSFDDRDDDFMVLAMEAAVGLSFDEIIRRIWETLNEGVPINRRARAATLPWEVRALMVVAFFHRFATFCPEPLLRRVLAGQGDAPDDGYAHELKRLEIADGWLIFRIVDGGARASALALIATMHSRVAARLWELRPDPAFDVAEWVLPASVTVPASAPYLAQVADIGRSGLHPADHMLTRRIITAWSQAAVPTWQFCRIVRELGYAASSYTLAPLRERWRRGDSQSWLAVWSLIQRARRGSDERDRLEQVDLLATLKKADLSVDPTTALAIAARSAYRGAVLGAVTASLGHAVGWRLSDSLLAWAIDSEPSFVSEHLDGLREWFTETGERAEATVALLRWYHENAATATRAGHDLVFEAIEGWAPEGDLPVGIMVDHFRALTQLRRLLRHDWPALRERVFDYLQRWLEQNDEAAGLVLIEYLRFLRGEVDPREWVAAGLGQLWHWLVSHPDDAMVRHEFLSAVARTGELDVVPISEVLAGTQEWLRGHPEDTVARQRFLWFVLNAGMAPPAMCADVLAQTRAWLAEHPQDNTVRVQFLAGIAELGPSSPVPLADVLAEAREWLDQNPDDSSVRVQLIKGTAELGAASPVPPAELLAQTADWLTEHPDDNHVRVQFIRAVVDLWETSPIPAAPVFADTRTWLAEHPDDINVRVIFIRAAVELGDASPVSMAQVLADIQTWLAEHPDDINVRLQFLLAVDALGARSPVPVADVLRQLRGWLAEHPEDAIVRQRFLTIVSGLGAASPVPLAAVLRDTYAWLQEHPEDSVVRQQFLPVLESAVAASPVPLGQVLAEVHAWLSEHPDDRYVRRRFVAAVAHLGPDSPVPRDQVLVETHAWLRAHPDDSVVREAFVSAVLELGPPAPIPVADVLDQTIAWRDAHAQSRLVPTAWVSTILPTGGA